MLNKCISLLFLLLALANSPALYATHIVGGEVSYQCLGNDQYKLTLKVYRDCNIQTPFDFNATVSAFKGNSNLPFQTFAMPLVSTEFISSDIGNVCAIVSNDVCVEEGIYLDTVTLAYHPQGYHLTYQRCCRNLSVTNISTAQIWGTSITIFISDLAQTTCNNSPTFDRFPPIYICQGEPINYDHSATDAEGDSLSYSFAHLIMVRAIMACFRHLTR